MKFGIWRCWSGARVLLILLSYAVLLAAQNSPYERTFHASKVQVEKALKQLQPAISGRLPTLDGFASQGERPLSRYQRGFYQTNVELVAKPTGTVVRVKAKITAWYADTNHPGYQVLTSNGRIEGDLLDQIAEQLVSTPGLQAHSSDPGLEPEQPASVSAFKKQNNGDELSAPLPQSAIGEQELSSVLKTALTPSKTPKSDTKKESSLEREVSSLEEALRNQAHPKNIVAVKKSGTPVVATPSLNGKALFFASLHDEFEMLDFNQDWVHVRISGISRGWIWRDSLEMPDGVPDNPQVAMGPAPAADIFQVTRIEDATFPGDWQPLRGKYVKIISVQEVRDAKDPGPGAKLAFAKYVLDKNFAELARKPDQLSGIVLIFDSVDGGMLAATFEALEKWKSGKLSDAALWHQCFFDPPETFTFSASSGSM